MTIKRLRSDNPGWAFRAERHGFGYRYIGTYGTDRVTVYACAVIVGMYGDDFETQWRVDDGKVSSVYDAWWLDRRAEQEAP